MFFGQYLVALAHFPDFIAASHLSGKFARKTHLTVARGAFFNVREGSSEQ